MASQEDVQDEIPEACDADDEETPGYVAPAPKSLQEIKELDKEDASLQKYKDTLLGNQEDAIIDDNNPMNCLVMSLSMVTEGRPDVEIDLTGDLNNLKNQVITIKEGVKYRLKIKFHVQREIVNGLKYSHVVYRKGIRVDKTNYMVGSYGPRKDVFEYLTPSDEAPSGMISRGKYTVKSKFIDDDKHEYKVWEWAFEIKKDWD